ncbi:hypothetical protein BKN38_03680 [Helicobacter sp. CLO-3]|uniref:AAA family ATPase n=1 Tax=unclassified Helicobacter TaxID=2593540 RepID=UPI0008049D59|nr:MULTISPECIES: AAA family ATPase [unclassified Helicobacter]OBV29262.1 hypothetical protein BA723_06345 [Helicobacter sp. CLO-3]OHU84138.1 hypothetical protein BKN38_03680 [Helicobacter sp. CLO-3]
MFISKITICNLFAYYGEITIGFKEQKDKNLYCIYGDNGFGKTSFIRCAKLLFLGAGTRESNIPPVIKRFFPKAATPAQFIKGTSNWLGILNKDAINEMKQDFFVSFEGSLDGKSFYLKRSFDSSGDIEHLLFKLDGETLHDDEAQDRINAILPPNLVEFFFFDGEELEALSDNLRTKLREKIDEILQIKPLDILVKQIGKYKDELKANEIANEELQLKLKNAKRSKESKEDEIKHLVEMLGNAEKFIEEKAVEIETTRKSIDKLEADFSKERAGLIDEKISLKRSCKASKKG